MTPAINRNGDGEADGGFDADAATYLGRMYFANLRDGMSRAVDDAIRRGGRASLLRSSRPRHTPGQRTILARQLMIPASHSKRTAIAKVTQASASHLRHCFRGAKRLAGASLGAFRA